MDCLKSVCNRKGWREMGVISWKIKLEKVKDWSPCFNSQDSHPPLNFCAAVRAILKSANLIAHAHTCVRTHTHTHRVPSGKIASSWAKQMSHFITWPLLISSMNSLTPYPASATHEKPQKQGHCYLLHLLFPQSITLSYLLFTWLTSAHPSVLKSYFTCHGKISMPVSQSLPMRLS